MKEKALPSNPFSLEGYITASIFIDILKKIQGDITIDKIINQIEKIKDYNFKGFPLNFDQKTRELAKKIWIIDENK